MTAGTESRGRRLTASNASSEISSQANKDDARRRTQPANPGAQSEADRGAKAGRAEDAGQTKTGIDEVHAAQVAEELLDQAGQRFGRLLLAGSQRLQRGLALAIEEAEDIWAEAQSIRRGDRSHSE